MRWVYLTPTRKRIVSCMQLCCCIVHNEEKFVSQFQSPRHPFWIFSFRPLLYLSNRFFHFLPDPFLKKVFQIIMSRVFWILSFSQIAFFQKIRNFMILRNRTCPKNKEFCVFPKKTCPKNKEFHQKWLHNRFLILGEALYIYKFHYVLWIMWFKNLLFIN